MVSRVSIVLYSLLSILSQHDIYIFGQVCSSKKVSIVADIIENTVNGTFEINTKDLHWHVSILEAEGEQGHARFLCGGALVRRGLVVTAAECVAHVNVTLLRAAVGLAFMRTHVEPHAHEPAVYNVSQKYYPYRDNYTVETDDLAILRLSNASGIGGAVVDSPRLTLLPEAARLSKHCFTIGWGHDRATEMKETCSRPGYKNALLVSLYHSKYSHMDLKNFLDFQNILGITKYVASGVSNVLSIFTNSSEDEFPQISEEPICPMGEYSLLKTVKMSASGKLRNSTACADTDAICLQARDSPYDLAHKVDIGSPIFCKIKKPKVGKHCPQQNLSTSHSQYVLAGVVTSKRVTTFPLIKHNTTMSVLKATNITKYSDFILSVLSRRS